MDDQQTRIVIEQEMPAPGADWLRTARNSPQLVDARPWGRMAQRAVRPGLFVDLEGSDSMKLDFFDLIVEPSGERLRGVGRCSYERGFYVLLVLRDELGISAHGVDFLERMTPPLKDRLRCDSGPGTILVGGEATVFRFKRSTVVRDQIVGASNHLYGWRQPHPPEDLGFLRKDGSAILTSSSHEGEAYLTLTEAERRVLLSSPEVERMVRRRPDDADVN
jgi:hypothetical protein